MADERTEPPIHPDYASALGVAVYSFASLEWDAVRCCERLEAGSIDRLEDRTAGRVADTLLQLVNELEPLAERDQLLAAATDFRFLVSTRNNLVHAKPGTAADGSQGLFRHGDHWTIAELQAVADARSVQSSPGQRLAGYHLTTAAKLASNQSAEGSMIRLAEGRVGGLVPSTTAGRRCAPWSAQTGI